MVNQFLPLTSDIHDWNTVPLVPPPTGAPIVTFDIPALGAGASQTLIPAQAGYQIQLTQLYAYYPKSNASSSLLFESADAADVALDVGASTDVNEVVGAGTLLLAANVAFEVNNPGAGAAEHLQGWVTYSYVVAGSAAPVVTQQTYDIPATPTYTDTTLLAGQAGKQLNLVKLYVYMPTPWTNLTGAVESSDGLNVIASFVNATAYNETVVYTGGAFGPGVGLRLHNPSAVQQGEISGWFTYYFTPYPP